MVDNFQTFDQFQVVKRNFPSKSFKMIVEHYRRDFMDHMIGHRVVILAHQDVDSVCTVKILTNLFKTEGVSYILLSCCGVADLKAKYDEYSSQSHTFVLINCGATIDLLGALGGPPKTNKFFVLDYHRPIHVINYYNTTGQVRIVSTLEPDEQIPEAEDVFGEEPDDDTDSEDEMDDDLDEEQQLEKANRRHERADLRRKYNEWQERREQILFKYREHCYYARPVTVSNILSISFIKAQLNKSLSFVISVVRVCFRDSMGYVS